MGSSSHSHTAEMFALMVVPTGIWFRSDFGSQLDSSTTTRHIHRRPPGKQTHNFGAGQDSQVAAAGQGRRGSRNTARRRPSPLLRPRRLLHFPHVSCLRSEHRAAAPKPPYEAVAILHGAGSPCLLWSLSLSHFPLLSFCDLPLMTSPSSPARQEPHFATVTGRGTGGCSC